VNEHGGGVDSKGEVAIANAASMFS